MASLAVGQGAQMANSAANATSAQNSYMMQGTAAQNAALADQAGGVGNLASAYIYSK